jgi:hypothetical protein
MLYIENVIYDILSYVINNVIRNEMKIGIEKRRFIKVE